MRIKILKNGPYIVTGGLPIREMVITPLRHHLTLEEGRVLPQAEELYLCRCGKSKNPPFCDGSHVHEGFDGTETASRKPFADRVEDVTDGKTISLLDDGRCCYARFCHTDRGDVWSLTLRDKDPRNRAAAIKAAIECPAGRLVMVDKEGNPLEEEYAPEIIIMQDPETQSSAGVFVKGPVEIESADGTVYEVRNRATLCRCGLSENKPFCDAAHVRFGFDDGHIED
jgi:CDGSH-type Zn-finger protein